MGIIKNIEVELSDLVRDCNLILEVEFRDVFVEEIAIKSMNPEVSPPPFKKQGFIFTVTNVLKNADKIIIPQTIRIPKEDWRRSLNQHKELYTSVPNKSYAVKQYKSEVKSMRNATILFLHHFLNSFELEGKSTFESIEARDKIAMLMKAK
ncbi:MAG: hypothetical protein ABI663_05335 [Chryseolinea sp.]